MKCDKYWSDEVGGIIDVDEADLKATTTSITTHRDFVIRTIIAKKVDDKAENTHIGTTLVKIGTSIEDTSLIQDTSSNPKT